MAPPLAEHLRAGDAGRELRSGSSLPCSARLAGALLPLVRRRVHQPGLCLVDTRTHAIPGMSLSVPHVALTPAEGYGCSRWRDSAHVVPSSSQRRALRSRPLCLPVGLRQPLRQEQSRVQPWLLPVKSEGSPWSRFSVRSTRWTRMSNRQDLGLASLCPHGDSGRQPGCLHALRGAECSLPACSSWWSRHLLGGMGASPLGQLRWQGMLETAGCAPSLLVLPEEGVRRAAGEVTRPFPECLLSAGSIQSFQCARRSAVDLHTEAPLD